MGTPVPLAQREPAVIQKVPNVSSLLVRVQMDPPQCPITHVEFIPSARGPSEACTEWGGQWDDCPLRDVPHKAGSHRPQASRGDLVDPEWAEPCGHPACPGPEEGWSVCPAGRHSGRTALCPPNRTAGLQNTPAKRATCPGLHGASSSPLDQAASHPACCRLCRPTPWATPKPDGGVWLQRAIRRGWAASCRGSGCPWGPGGP